MKPSLLAAMMNDYCQSSEDQEPATPEQLQEMLAAFQSNHAFSIGQVVQWKQGMRNKEIQSPFVVESVLSEPVIDADKGTGSCYFREPLDVVVGYIENGVFNRLHVDSRRLEPLPAQ